PGHRDLDLPSRRTQGARGHGSGPRATAERARRYLAEPGGGRQPLLDLGPPGARGDPSRPAAGRQQRRDAGDGSGILLGAGPPRVLARAMNLDSRTLYLLLLAAVVLERLFELALTRRNAARLVARGGFAVGDGHYPWMVLMHTALLAAAP